MERRNQQNLESAECRAFNAPVGKSLSVSKKPIEVRLANGKVFRVTDPSTKRLDPKLKKASQIRASSILRGMKKAAKEAKRRGVPLREILPIS
jgi:hypothetical protein